MIEWKGEKENKEGRKDMCGDGEGREEQGKEQ